MHRNAVFIGIEIVLDGYNCISNRYPKHSQTMNLKVLLFVPHSKEPCRFAFYGSYVKAILVKSKNQLRIIKYIYNAVKEK